MHYLGALYFGNYINNVASFICIQKSFHNYLIRGGVADSSALLTILGSAPRAKSSRTSSRFSNRTASRSAVLTSSCSYPAKTWKLRIDRYNVPIYAVNIHISMFKEQLQDIQSITEQCSSDCRITTSVKQLFEDSASFSPWKGQYLHSSCAWQT